MWEADELNALTVGHGPKRGLIAVTRGLIDGHNDDELAAVLAHEAAHIRNGDTLLLAVNHALHRTAMSLSLENPFRVRPMGGIPGHPGDTAAVACLHRGHLATWLATSLSWRARARLAIRRDHLADAAAVRATHDPAALVSAIRKVAVNGRFDGLVRVANLTFESCGANAGAPSATAAKRIATVTLASELHPQRYVEIGRKFGVGAGSFCSGRSYPDCKCPE